MPWEAEVTERFDGAHFIPGHEGKCRQMHGHTYTVTLRVRRKNLNSLGMVCDFGILRDALRSRTSQLDHQVINDVLVNGPPTAERIAEWIGETLCYLEGLYSVSVQEGDGGVATYYLL